MAEYIDREALFAEFDRLGLGEHSIVEKVFSIGVRTIIAGMPAADVATVVHGRWGESIDEWFGTDVYTCSKCRESYVLVEGTPKQNLWHYCPNCGAKMDGGGEDAAD